MANKYGPWATLIDTGVNPQLSSFWRRRLAMLVPASQTSPILSRHNLLWLFAAATLTCVLPTFFFTPAVAQEKKPAQETKTVENKNAAGKIILGDSANNASTEKSSTTSEQKLFKTVVGIVTVTSADFDSGSFILPGYIFSGLGNESTRKELKITPDQEKKLRELSDRFLKQQQDVMGNFRKETQKLTPEELAAKKRELLINLTQARRAAREQIDKLLTPEQLSAVKNMCGMSGAGLIIDDKRFQEKIGISPEQMKELSQRLFEDVKNEEKLKEKNRLLENSYKEFAEKALAVLTPQQWEKLEQLVGDSETGLASLTPSGARQNFYPGPEIQELSYPDLREKLSLSDEQQKKLDAIRDKSQEHILEFSKTVNKMGNGPATEERNAGNDAFRKLEEMRKLDYQQIKAALSPEQWIAFKKSRLRNEFLFGLDTFQSSNLFNGGKGEPGILDLINATEQQKDELRHLAAQKDKIMRQGRRDTGEIILKILNPQQQEKLFEELDGQADKYLEPPADAWEPPAQTQASLKDTTTAYILYGTSADDAKASNPDNKVDRIAPIMSSSAETENLPESNLVLHDDVIALPAYHLLITKNSLKEIKITEEQEKKLREIARSYQLEEAKIAVNYRKMSPQEQKTKQDEIRESFQQIIKPARKQIEAVLTADQLAAVKDATLHSEFTATILMSTPVGEKIGLSAEQKKQLDRLQAEMQAKMNRSFRNNMQQLLAVLSSQQREKLMAKFAQADGAGPMIDLFSFEADFYTVTWSPMNKNENPYRFSFSSSLGSISLYPGLEEEDIRKEIGLSPEQQAKLQALSARFQPEVKNIFASFDKMQELPPEEQKTKQAELRRKLEETGKTIRREIEETLTAGQLKALHDAFSRDMASGALVNPNWELIEYANTSQEQMEKLRRIREDGIKSMQQLISETYDKSLKILTPRQLELLKQELDNQNW